MRIPDTGQSRFVGFCPAVQKNHLMLVYEGAVCVEYQDHEFLPVIVLRNTELLLDHQPKMEAFLTLRVFEAQNLIRYQNQPETYDLSFAEK
ncbi:hypothetical protein C0J52_21740 [Blattella germanica]|nr:hypothetical protein C0J52_21740 [Blattella germanica]